MIQYNTREQPTMETIALALGRIRYLSRLVTGVFLVALNVSGFAGA